MKAPNQAAEKISGQAGVNFPDGFEDLHTKEDVIKALAALKTKRSVIKKSSSKNE